MFVCVCVFLLQAIPFWVVLKGTRRDQSIHTGHAHMLAQITRALPPKTEQMPCCPVRPHSAARYPKYQ